MENTNKGFAPTRMIKKAFAVLMTLVMVFSCWVFAPEMFTMKAEAVSSGNYTVTINITVTNKADKTGNIQDSYYYVYYKPNNGKGTETYTKFDIKDYLLSETTRDVTFTVSGFPTKLYYYHDAVWKDYVFYQVNSIKVCGKLQSSPNKLIQSGGVGNSSTDGNFTWTLDYPYANTAEIVDQPGNITIPTGSTPNTKTFTAKVKDQYGVVISSAATGYSKSVSLSPVTTFTSPDSDTGMSVAYTSTNSEKDTFTISADNSAKKKNIDVFTEKATVTYTFNGHSVSATTNNFTVTDPEYAFTLNQQGGSLTTPSTNPVKKKYYNQFGYTPAASKSGFTLIGYYDQANGDSNGNYYVENPEPSGTKLTSTTRIESDKTWYAAWKANKYTVTFSYYDGVVDAYNVSNLDLTTSTQTDYIGSDVVPPGTVPSGFLDNNDFRYTFSGWYPVIAAGTTKIPANNATVYTATYTKTLVAADYTQVNYWVNKIDYKKAETEYAAMYTPASRANVETALNGIIYGLGASKQNQVDNMATNLENAYNGLEKNKYTVLFLDENGNILPGGYHFVEYGTEIVPAATPTKPYDDTYHYVNGRWDATQTELNKCASVKENLTFFATFDAVEHFGVGNTTYEPISSTCTEAGQKKKICNTCGYFVIEDNASSDPAHHVWAAVYTTDIPATCTTKGSESIHCTVCGISDTTTKRDIPATGHTWNTSAPGADANGWVVVSAATCTREGQRQRTCSTCNYTAFDTIPATGVHNWEFESTISATCNTNGYDVYLCTMCQAIDRRNEVAALGHNWGDWTTIVESSCITQGFEERQCDRCLAKETNTLALADHTEPAEYTTITAATCTENGEKAKFCEVCGKEIENTRETIPALDHNYETQVDIAATCQQPGIKVEVCTRCSDTQTTDIPKLDHHFVETVTPATCVSTGYTVKVCDNDIDGQPCGYTEYVDFVDPLGHSYVTTPDFLSLKDYDVTAHPGDEAYFAYTAADCTHAAYWTLTCKNDCGNTVIVRDEEHGATQHTWSTTENDGWVVDFAATCIADGQETRTCITPGCDYSVSRDIPKLGHIWGEWETVTPATNDTDGLMQRTCSRNTCSDCVETAVIPMGGHIFDMDNPDSEVPATCHSTGTQTFNCKNPAHTVNGVACGETITVITPYAPHTIEHETVAETCTENGYVFTFCTAWSEDEKNAYITAALNNETYTGNRPCEFEPNYVITYAIGHSYDNGHIKDGDEPTCTIDGKKTFTCQRANCGHELEQVIPKLGHAWEIDPNEAALLAGYTTDTAYVQYIEPDCMTSGHWELTCMHGCGQKIDIDNTSATSTGHVWVIDTDTDADGWKVTVQPTCTETGTAERTCKYTCDTTETTVVAALGHSYGAGVVLDGDEPTCTTEGTMTFTCTRAGCTESTEGHTKTESLSILGHAWVVDITMSDAEIVAAINALPEGTANIEYTAPDCAHGGYWTLTCGNGCCTTYVVTNYDAAPSTGHIWVVDADTDADGWQIVTPATCTTDGEKKRDCSYGCDTTETAFITRLGHDFNAAIDENVTIVTAATCIHDGEKTVKCSRCTELNTVIIPATGVHVYGKSVVTEPTCVEPGYTTHYCTSDPECTMQYSDSGTPAIGHLFAAEWTIDVHPTCTETGLQSRHCTRNGCTECVDKVVIGATGHTYADWEIITEPTCTDMGLKKHRCTNSYPVNGVIVYCDHEETAPVNVLPHQWQSVYTTDVEPTCTSEGQKSIHCGVCGGIRPGSVVAIPKYEHNYSATWTTDILPTCTAEGREYRECRDCHAKDYRALAPYGHEYDLNTVVGRGAASDGSYTWNAYRCIKCESRCVVLTIVAISADTNSTIGGAEVTVRRLDGGLISTGKTDAAGTFTTAPLPNGTYAVNIRTNTTQYYYANGELSVNNGVVTGTIGVGGRLTQTTCGNCSCHKNNFIGRLKRWFNSFFSVIFKRTIKCCPDMEWHDSFKDRLK